ncbi:MAG: aminotransferase class I/II-fold pyridoxal phosphate-dependent enzyme [Actinobacteria bacterium]|nr:aminotransferase class I/II-fold pyridoxal phosphate-dependent enzyme [Actinomycetota bacterium]
MVRSPDPEPETGLAPETRAITAGRADNDGALAPIVWATTAFEVPTIREARRLATRPRATRFYTRHGNPSVRAFEDALAELEGAEASLAFASGMGAIFATVMSLCGKGSHVVAQRQCYGGTLQLLNQLCPRVGIEVTLVDGTRPGAFAEAVRPGETMVVLAETPANPRLDLVDLDELGAITGPITVVDSTFATPLGQRPLDHGVDLVIHSATKAIAGHNDASLGVVAGVRDLVDWVWGFAVLQGAVPSPHDATAALRGLRTLGVRLRQQSATALALASTLEGRADVGGVRYPGLASHPQAALAARQLRHGGGLLTFDLPGGIEAGERFVEAVRLCRPAPSLGGPETLVTHPASTTHAGLSDEELVAAGITGGTIRVSAGLEDTDDVVADVLAAVAASTVDQ